MPFFSPLRYPGGKRRLTAFVGQLLEFNHLREVQYVEPFAGGASLALALLFEEHASVIHLNDLSRPIYAFWHSVLHDTEDFCDRVAKTTISMSEWHRQKAIYESRQEANLEELGFATFFLNRTNRSGIIAGGVIGGQDQSGKWLLDARFNKRDLLRRLRRLGRYRDRIQIYNQDGILFTKDVVKGLGENTFTFLDPPYIARGQGLYLNNYSIADHRRLEEQVIQLKQPWIVTYDYQGAVKHNLYHTHQSMAFELSYSAQERQKGKEALFLSPDLKLPVGRQQELPFNMSKFGNANPSLAISGPESSA